MANKIKGVTIQVHPLFFNNILEKNRKSLEKKLNKSFTQIEVTGIMANNFSLKLKPINKKFFPKPIKKRNFRI